MNATFKSGIIASLLGICAMTKAQAGIAEENTPVALPAGVDAVWDLSKAFRESTRTQERLSINGLWRWQPAGEEVDHVPSANWGYFKVPGCWPGITDYMQKDCQTVYAHPSWQNGRLGRIAAAWYEREISIPSEWEGRRIVLTAEYVNSFATLFIDDQRVGELRYPAGQIDLTAVCRPGQQHVLSMHVIAMPLKGVMLSYRDTASARQVKGEVVRRGLCGDVYLASSPAGPRIGQVKVVTSVRKWNLSLGVELAGLSDSARYVLKAQVTDGGTPVLEFASKVFQADQLQAGQITVSETWHPKKLWDVHTPQHMYQLHLSLCTADEQHLDDSLPVRFGFREFWIEGRDFYLNGTRIFLSSVPLDNAQVGAAWANYDAACESMQRLASFGINFVYTHNYGCEPGSHLSFEEILRAADDVGMLISFSQPHFSHYDWDSPTADQSNGYARHAAFYVRVAQNHPSVVAYSTSHNATGYGEDMNPDMIDGIQDRRSEWSERNVTLAAKVEGIITSLDPSRIVYHHASGNLGSLHTSNFYANFAPIQEMSDWFSHWSLHGVKPLFTCEYSVPMPWDYTMYRGWYQGHREFGSAAVPWEFCIAEWNAQFYGDRAYQISEQEKANLRWEAKQFQAGNLWHRWDYPHQVGSNDFAERYGVYAMYFADNWPAFRTWEVSANSPWNHGHYWTLREGVDKSRQQLTVAWQDLQRPGLSPDYIDDRYETIDLAFERSDWTATVAAKTLIRFNAPLLGYIAGKAQAFTSKDHNFFAGDSVEKQLIVINNSRETVQCMCNWSLDLPAHLAGSREIALATGEQERITMLFELPQELAAGRYTLNAVFQFSNGETQEDAFSIDVLPRPAPLDIRTNVALFDPHGETRQVLDRLGVSYRAVNADARLSAQDVLVVGKNALTISEPAPDITCVKEGLKVLMFEQTPEVLEARCGFRVAAYGLRQLFPRAANHPVLAGITENHLSNWHGEATILPPRLTYAPTSQFSDAPTVRWSGIPVSRLWRCGNRGNVASALIEKPARGDFLPILDGGYSLQYSALLEYREGTGMVLFCQADVTGRTEDDPASEILIRNMLEYIVPWQPRPKRQVVYAGDATWASHLRRVGISVLPFRSDELSSDQLLVVGPGAGGRLSTHKGAIAAWLAKGGHVLALGLEQQEANSFLPGQVETKTAEHIACYFDPPAADSLLAGISPADVHSPAPIMLPLVSAGATILGDGIVGIAADANVVFCQLPPDNVRQALGELPSFAVNDEEAIEGTQSAVINMGTVPWSQFIQKVKPPAAGKTYTFAAAVKAVDEPVRLRLEVERAGSPWDRAARSDETLVPSDKWTELHHTFNVDKAYPEGWSAYIHCGQTGARFRIDQCRLYEGTYVPQRNAPEHSPTEAGGTDNLFANPGFESGTDEWLFSYRTAQHNLKRTYRRHGYLVSRLLANLGAASSTPLLERFSSPVGDPSSVSALKNGDFAGDEDADGVPDQWLFSRETPATTCTRVELQHGTDKWSLTLNAPPNPDGKKLSTMLAQHDVPVKKGQWYRISLRAKAEQLAGRGVTMTIANMANWHSVFDYQSFQPGANWQQYDFEVQSNDSAERGTRFQIWYSGSGRLWLADIRMDPIPDPATGRWLDGFYLDAPEHWDDPYRFFRW